jgi:hypothetical protein
MDSENGGTMGQTKSYNGVAPPTTKCGSNCRACMRWFVWLAHEYYRFMHDREKVQFT